MECGIKPRTQYRFRMGKVCGLLMVSFARSQESELLCVETENGLNGLGSKPLERCCFVSTGGEGRWVRVVM